MATEPIQPFEDSRVRWCSTQLNGKPYQYILGQPEEGFSATVFLIHGWPDLSFGWRHQIPALLDLGLRVVCPDSMGYGGTAAPRVPSEAMAYYGFKRAADDMKELADQLGAPKIILGGHDWGGAIVYRIAYYYPDLVSHLFSICTPYFPPSKTYNSVEDVVRGGMPNFAYQIQLSGPDVEARIQDKTQIRQFLNAVYGGTDKTHGNQPGFSVSDGVIFDRLPNMGQSPLVSEKEMDFYVEQYARSGLHGPLNWYRTRRQNFEDEKGMDPNTTYNVPFLFIQATKDVALLPSMSRHMPKFFSNMTKKEVEAGHWLNWQKPEEVNAILKEWIGSVVFGGKSRL